MSWTYIIQSADVHSKFAQFANKKIVFPDAAFPNLTWAIHFLVSHSLLAIKVLQTAIELGIAGVIYKAIKKPITFLKGSGICCFNRNTLIHSNKSIWTDVCTFIHISTEVIRKSRFF